jgi:hypothetical protein
MIILCSHPTQSPHKQKTALQMPSFVIYLYFICLVILSANMTTSSISLNLSLNRSTTSLAIVLRDKCSNDLASSFFLTTQQNGSMIYAEKLYNLDSFQNPFNSEGDKGVKAFLAQRCLVD